MDIREATDQSAWDDFLSTQKFRPFLQSWTMGEVYKAVKQEPVRLEILENGTLIGICQAMIVNARRGRHLSVPYGPIINHQSSIAPLTEALKQQARKYNCSFVRLSPFRPAGEKIEGAIAAPLHLLAEHIWYVPLTTDDRWKCEMRNAKCEMRSKEDIMKSMRKNTRNLIRRAEKEGVTIEQSENPVKDLEKFIELHEETRKRHSFTPYSNTFFRAQTELFAARNECTLYKAMYQGEVIASSIHMHTFGETSYHHGASTHKYSKIPASYLLQWTAMQDAIKREDHVYNFWGISPEGVKNHPFAGVRTFKTGFGGELLEIAHCQDIAVKPSYWMTRGFETVRKLKRGF